MGFDTLLAIGNATITILLAAVVLIHLLAHRQTQRPLDVCSCGHTWAFHRKDGVCVRSGWTTKLCDCVRFDGIPPAHVGAGL